MTSAVSLAAAITSAFVEVIHPGEDRPVLTVEIADSSEETLPGSGDLVLAVGYVDVDDLVRLVREAPGVAGLVVRAAWGGVASLRAACREADTSLIALTDGVTWSVAAGLFRAHLEAPAVHGDGELTDHVYGDLFDLADLVSTILAAPVTIEDASSKVVAYSTGQDDVDAARMSSIFGRQVPRHVRNHFRSLGVFRRLAQSADPFFVPGAENDVKGRFIVPVHAGGEWLGSVWAVVDEPTTGREERELKAAAELIALHLLKLRSRGALAQQLQLDQIRSALQGAGAGSQAVTSDGPWRVVVLRGPERALEATARRELWTALAGRSGWRRPLITDLDGRVYAIVDAVGTAPGSWDWLSGLVESEAERRPAVGARAGSPVASRDGLTRSRAEADEVESLAGLDIVTRLEDQWHRVVLARALTGVASGSPVSPLRHALERSGDPEAVAATLEAVIDHWGEPRRAARQLGVHPNTVRYRLGRLTPELGVDLDAPAQRMALRLEIALLRSTTAELTDPDGRARGTGPSPERT